jgi:hypothetical protein
MALSTISIKITALQAYTQLHNYTNSTQLQCYTTAKAVNVRLHDICLPHVSRNVSALLRTLPHHPNRLAGNNSTAEQATAYAHQHEQECLKVAQSAAETSDSAGQKIECNRWQQQVHIHPSCMPTSPTEVQIVSPLLHAVACCGMLWHAEL